MANLSGGPPTGELHSHAPPYDYHQNGMTYGTDATHYYGPQGFQLQNHVPKHDQSANTYAFNSNSHLLPANFYSGPSMASNLSHGNDRPEVFPASSNHQPTLFPAYGTHPISEGPSATAPTTKPVLTPQEPPRKALSSNTLGGINGNLLAAQDPSSDMEDGELSEDADHISAVAHLSENRESISHPSLKANGTAPTKRLEQDGLRQDETGVYQRNERGIRATNGQVKHGPNTRLADQFAGPATRKLDEMSLHVAQNGARQAVAQLQRYDIGYAQLLEEHIHPDLLRSLYLELAKRTHETVPSSKPSVQVVQPHPLPKKLSDPTFHQQAPDIPIHKAVAEVSETKSSMNAGTKKFPQQHQLGISDVSIPGTQAQAISERPQPHKESPQEQPSRVSIGELATSNSLTSKPKDQSNRDTVSNVLSGNEKMSAPVVTDNKSHSDPAAAPKILQTSSAAHPTVKPAIPKAATKPVDRKDYIARLQAAKAGKVAPATTASQLSLGAATQKTSQDSSSSVTGQVGAASPSANVSSKNSLPAQMTSSIDSPVTTVSSINPAVETKKREQTELARRKIEELKNRSNLPKETQSATDEFSLTAPSTKQRSDPIKQPLDIQPNQTSAKTSNSDNPSATPQHAYFPFRSGTFSLPGLFMVTSSDRDNREAEAPKVATVQDGPRDAREPDPTIAPAFNAEKSLSQSFSILSSSQDEQGPRTTTTSQVTQAQPISNPRKRPTAADFIEAAPSKIQRSYSYKADSSVVFEVSDDEGDDFEDEGSDVQMSGDPNMKALHSRKAVASDPTTPDDLKSRQHLGMNDPHVKSEKLIGRPNIAQSSPQTSNKKDAAGLRAREEEIQRMNRKIIEMEQRRKMRQDVSRTQTPGTPGRPTPFPKPNESSSNVQDQPEGIQQLSEPQVQATLPTQQLEDVPNDEAAVGNTMSMEPQGESPKQNGDVQPPAEHAETSPKNGNEQQLQRRKTEIENILSSADAAVENLRARLEILHRDEVELQTRIQKEVDSKRAFQEELAKLHQASFSSPTLPGQGDEEPVELQQATDGQQPVTTMPLEQAQDDGQVPAIEPTNISDEAPTDGDVTKKPETGPMSETALSNEAPTNQSLISGELAEDVMDISGSEDEGEVTDSVPIFSTDEGQLVAESDSEEPYEPPSSFGGMEDVSKLVTDPSRPQRPLTDESLRQHDSLEANHAPPASDNKVATEAHVAAEEQLHDVSRPGPSQSPIDLSDPDDSDDYEPPEPVASVDLASLTSDTAAAVAKPAFSPSDINHNLQASATSPDALPAVIDQVDVERMASARSALEQVWNGPLFTAALSLTSFRHGSRKAMRSMAVSYRMRVHCSSFMLIATTRILSRL
ncbi:MAG: hypothetical protein Q9221_001659 [Calogaya cf. arnoldii]